MKFLNKKAFTMVEILVATLPIVTMLLAAFALYNASQVFYFKANNKITISYELQYALDHVYKNVMQAIGDETDPTGLPTSRAIEVDSGVLYVYLYGNDPINDPINDPVSQSTYANETTYAYSKVDDTFNFNNGSTDESLIPKVTVTDVSFSIDGNILTVSISATHGTVTDAITLYSSCYPRLASF